MSTFLPMNGAGSLVPSQIPRSRPVKEEEAVGCDVFGGWILRIDLLTCLAWDYIETIIDICIRMRIKETKPLIRRIRELKRIFEQDRSYYGGVSDQSRRDERQNAEEFEDQFDQDFRRLFNGLEFETRKIGLEKDYETLAIATQQAMTILDATKIFLKDCDKEVRKLGYKCDDYHMAPEGFLPLFGLVPQFAGDCYKQHIEARRLTAEILVKRVKGIEFTEIDDEQGGT
ncbi:MAG: hypothetical protein K2N48_01480 [Muribaculaceae bacterium]|nr:hypothetical protein [Muribaculaceae bacterium]